MAYPSSGKTILIGQETTWGTAVTADKDIGLIQDISDDFTREVQEHLGMGLIDTQQVTTGNVDQKGSFTLKYQNGRMLEYALGSVGHVETTSDWVHTFTASNTPPSFTLESSEAAAVDTVRTMEGCMVESLELSIENPGVLMMKVAYSGQTVESTSSATAAVVDNLIVFPKSLVSITLGGVAITQAQNFSITIQKVVKKTWGIGSNLPVDGQATEMRYKFAGKVGFASVADQERAYGGTTPPDAADPAGIAVVLDADNGVSLGSGQRQVIITLGNAQYDKFTVVGTFGDLVFADLAGSGTLTSATSTDDISSSAWS